MSDLDTEKGPAMICATRVLRSEGARIGRIAGIQLPRTVKIVNVVAVGVGAVVGLLLAMIVNAAITSAFYGVAFGGALGWFTVSYSPLQGESMAKWFELQFLSNRRSRYINGKRVTLAVGVAYLPSPPRGRVQMQRAAVHIPPSQYDERGVLRSTANRNVEGADRWLAAALALPDEQSMSMSPVDDQLHTGQRAQAAPGRVTAAKAAAAKAAAVRPARASADAGPRMSTDTAPRPPLRVHLPGRSGTGSEKIPSKPRRLKD